MKDTLFKLSVEVASQAEEITSLKSLNTDLGQKYCDLKVLNEKLSLKLELATKDGEKVSPLQEENLKLRELLKQRDESIK